MKFTRSLTLTGKLVANVLLGLGEFLVDLLDKDEYALPLLLAVLAIAAAIAIAWLTFPVSPFLVISAAAWWLTRKRAAVWSKALAQVLLPVTVGLFLLFICILTLNTLELTVATEDIRAAEMILIELRLSLKSWITFSWPVFSALLAVLVALSHVISRSRLVTRFFQLQKIASWLVIVLTTLTTFTFFSQYPIDGWTMREHEQRVAQSNSNVHQYELLLRQEKDAVAEYLAIRTLEGGVHALEGGDRDTLGLLFRTIDRTAAEVPLGTTLVGSTFRTADERAIRERRIDKLVEAGRLIRFGRGFTGPSLDLRNDVVESFAARHAEEVVKEPGIQDLSARFMSGIEDEEEIARRNLAAILVERQPATEWEWRDQSEKLAAQREELEQQEAQTARRQATTSEAMIALTKLFSKTVAVGVPDLGGLPEVFLKKLVSSYAQHIFMYAAARWTGRNLNASDSQTQFAVFTEASLPDGIVARRLLVPRLGSRQERLKLGFESQAEIERRVQSMTKDRARIIREHVDQQMPTLEEQIWLTAREAQRRGITVDELVRERRELSETIRRGPRLRR